MGLCCRAPLFYPQTPRETKSHRLPPRVIPAKTGTTRRQGSAEEGPFLVGSGQGDGRNARQSQGRGNSDGACCSSPRLFSLFITQPLINLNRLSTNHQLTGRTARCN
jgi:hypothetical protein